MALKGIKQFFGIEEGQKNLKKVLEHARLTIKNEYANLRVTKCKYSEQCGAELSKAWKSLKNFRGDGNSPTDEDIKDTIEKCGKNINDDGKGFEDFLKFTAAFKAVYSHCSRFKGTYPYSAIGDLIKVSLDYALYVGTWRKNSVSFNDNNITLLDYNNKLDLKPIEEKKLDDVFEKELDSIKKKLKPGGNPSSFRKAFDWIESMTGKVHRALAHPIDSIIAARSDDTAYGVKAKRMENKEGGYARNECYELESDKMYKNSSDSGGL